MRRDQTRRLEAAGITTVAQLARAADEARPASMPPQTFETLRDQAAMQVAARANGHAWKVLAPEPARGFELLPPPTGGDLFFDIEGDPFWEPGRGLEYLWGIVDTAGRFTPFWAHDRAQERRAVEGVIDLIRERRAAHPAMHVYHYAAYEITALKRLTCEYGTREEELDDLLRGEVFVDLYKVVSQGLRLSHERYGLKQVETFYFERTADLRAGDDSILLYEDYARDARPADPRRDRGLQRGGLPLDARAARLAARRSGPGRRRRPRSASRASRPPTRPRPRSSAPRSSPGSPTTTTTSPRPTGRAGSLAQLLLYHRREEKPVWWSFFARIGRTPEELQERDADAIGGLEPAGPPTGSGESLVWPFTLPRAAAPSRARATRSTTPRPADPPARSRSSTRRPERSDSDAGPRSRTSRCPSRSSPAGPTRPPEQRGGAPAARALGTRRRRPLSRSQGRSSAASRSRLRFRRTTSTRRRSSSSGSTAATL